MHLNVPIAAVILALATAPAAAQQADSASLTAAQQVDTIAPFLLNGGELKQLLAERAARQGRRPAPSTGAVLHVLVSDSGTVDSVRVISSAGLSRLDGVAHQIVEKARYTPARANAQPVQAWSQLSVDFPRRNGPSRAYVAAAPTNRESVLAEFTRARRGMYDERIAAEVELAVGIGADHRVTSVELLERTCMLPFDEAAQRAVRALEFEPVPDVQARFTLMTLSWGRDGAKLLVKGDSSPAPKPHARDTKPEGDGPTRRPELLNRNQIARELVREYPTALRNAGIGGQTTIWVFIDEEGAVKLVRLSQSSGHCELDVAGLRLATRMRFANALSKGEPVAVWVEIPLIFSSRAGPRP